MRELWRLVVGDSSYEEGVVILLVLYIYSSVLLLIYYSWSVEKLSTVMDIVYT